MSSSQTDLTPSRLRDEIDATANLSEALVIVTESEPSTERAQRAIRELAQEISRRLDNLYSEVQEALDDPKSFLGKKSK